jgi:aspartate 1-decarboxylase
MEAANLHDYEAIQVWNVTRGTRLETYAITGQEKDGNAICSNGAAAHLMRPQDIIIIAAFAFVDAELLDSYEPTVVLVDENNQIKGVGPEFAGPSLRPK